MSVQSTSDCGCCEGIEPLTPANLWNAPGLPSIRYRAGTYGKFRETMVTSLAKYPKLSALTTRDDDDLAIGLIDSWAVVGDVLTFYQERIANEGFLRTATERLSILELGREIGYELRPGVAASADLAFTIDTSGAVTSTLIDVGTKVQSIPMQGKSPPEMPQTFETVEAIVARPEFNSIKPRQTVVQALTPSSVTKVVFAGTDTKLKVGDRLLFVNISGLSQVPSAIATVADVKVSTDSSTTTVLVSDLITSIQTDLLPFSPGTPWVGPSPVPDAISELDLSSVQYIISTYKDVSALTAFLSDKGWDPQAFANAVNSFADELTPVSTIEVYALRLTAGFFGGTAPAYGIQPTTLMVVYPVNWDTDFHVAIDTDSQGIAYDSGGTVYLDNTYSSILPDSWVIVQRSGLTAAYRVANVVTKSLSDYLLSSKVTGLNLDVTTVTSSVGPPQPFYRLNNGKDHFYTISSWERSQSIRLGGYWFEGISSYAFPSDPQLPNVVPLYRLNNGTDHFYTTDDVEKQDFIDHHGYNDEGIACYVYSTLVGNTTPLFRLYNGTDHFYTASSWERDNAKAHYGYALEKTACYVFATVPTQLSSFRTRETVAYAQSERLELAQVEDVDSLQSASITLDKVYAGLQVGQGILVTGELEHERGLKANELVSISDVTPFVGRPPVTKISLTPTLANVYNPKSLTINANVTPATHGETKGGPIGGGDPTQPYLDLTLSQKPLTYVHATTPSGTQTTLEVRVDGLLWKEAPSLYGLEASSRSYAVRRDDDGTTHVLFGDARPAAGAENISAKYRVGIGSAGLVRAGQLSLLTTKPLGVRTVTNPFDSSGAADPEDRDHARTNAPLTVLTLDRIVSLSDVQNFVLAFAGIGKALALWNWSGDMRVVRLIVATPEGTAVDSNSDLYSSLIGAIEKFKDPSLDVQVDLSFSLVPFNIHGWVLVDAQYLPDQVGASVTEALRSRFSFQSGDFGRPVRLSDVMGAIQLVDGVEATEVDEFYPSGQSPSENEAIGCKVNEVLVLNPGSEGINLDIRSPPQ